jgi:hypothetical protein
MSITFDGPNKLVLLDGSLTVSIRAIVSRWTDWHAVSDNSKYLPAFQTIADPPTVPLYATLINGWLVRPLGGSYILTLNDGFLYRDGGGDPFAAVASGAEPRIRWENPVIAVGFASGDSPQQADIDAIRAKTDQLMIEAGLVAADLQTVRGQALAGSGTTADPWRPA